MIKNTYQKISPINCITKNTPLTLLTDQVVSGRNNNQLHSGLERPELSLLLTYAKRRVKRSANSVPRNAPTPPMPMLTPTTAGANPKSRTRYNQ